MDERTGDTETEKWRDSSLAIGERSNARESLSLLGEMGTAVLMGEGRYATDEIRLSPCRLSTIGLGIESRLAKLLFGVPGGRPATDR